MAGATYATFDHYVASIRDNPPQKRPDFLERIKYATIRVLPDQCSLEQALAIGAAMAYGWIRESIECPNCGRSFTLIDRTDPESGRTYILGLT